MFKFIDKTAYFDAIKTPHPEALDRWSGDLKHIQDLVLWSLIKDYRSAAILEAGGGATRMLRALDPSNQMTNADEFLGNDGGPGVVDDAPGVVVHRHKVGERLLPAGSFDLIFSVSVIEHIPSGAALEAFFSDIHRLLKPGARTVHAIDVYLHTDPNLSGNDDIDKFLIYSQNRVHEYRRLIEGAGLRFDDPPSIDFERILFHSSYATNSDGQMLAWERWAPNLAAVRRQSQSCSLIVSASKPG